MSRSLTENQQNFVNEILNGVDNLVLIARAGCGKTTTIEEALIQYTKKFPLKKAVAFCFNVNIKDELRARGLKAYNFHGFGLFIISTKFKSFNPKKDIDEDKGFRIAIEIMNLDASNMSDQDIKDARSIQKLCSLAKSFNCSYSDAWNTDETWKFIIDYYDIKTYKQVNLTDIGKQCLKKMSYWDGTVDYDDLVWLPVVRGWLFPFVDLALVDEAQDLNAIQFEFIRRIIKSDKVTKKKIGRMAFVLDPSQALYTWRAAMINAHEHIIKRFNCKTMPLNETFRCGKKIVQEAQYIVPDIKAFDSNEEGIVDNVSLEEMYDQCKQKDFIVSRTRAPLFAAALQFLGRGIPARVKGQDFANELIDLIKESDKESIEEFKLFIENWKNEELENLSKKHKNNPDLYLKKSGRIIDIHSVLMLLGDKVDSTEDLISLIELICLPKEKKDFIELYTVHGAKGLESDRVFLILNSFSAQIDRENKSYIGMKEEGYILYTAITRAKKHLSYVK